MFIFLQLRVVVCGEHFTVGVYVYSGALGLFQQFFDIFQIVSANENSRIVTYTDVYFCDFGVTVTASIGFIQLCHSGYSMFTCFQSQLN